MRTSFTLTLLAIVVLAKAVAPNAHQQRSDEMDGFSRETPMHTTDLMARTMIQPSSTRTQVPTEIPESDVEIDEL